VAFFAFFLVAMLTILPSIVHGSMQRSFVATV
jgi:hypothetical protein